MIIIVSENVVGAMPCACPMCEILPIIYSVLAKGQAQGIAPTEILQVKNSKNRRSYFRNSK